METRRKARRLPLDYDSATTMFIHGFGDYVTEYFGERCPEFNEDCPACAMWQLYDQARELTDYDGNDAD